MSISAVALLRMALTELVNTRTTTPSDYCPDCGDPIQQGSEKVACSCRIWEVLPDR
jgi:hypothetical protein